MLQRQQLCAAEVCVLGELHGRWGQDSRAGLQCGSQRVCPLPCFPSLSSCFFEVGKLPWKELWSGLCLYPAAVT